MSRSSRDTLVCVTAPCRYGELRASLLSACRVCGCNRSHIAAVGVPPSMMALRVYSSRTCEDDGFDCWRPVDIPSVARKTAILLGLILVFLHIRVCHREVPGMCDNVVLNDQSAFSKLVTPPPPRHI